MKTVIVSDVIGIINKIAPIRFAESWDNPGLQVGDPSAQVTRVMVALDACQSSVEAAIEQGCSLLLTHHPLIFKPLKRVSCKDMEGGLVFLAIENKLSIAALHTNYDIAVGGVNDLLAERLAITVAGPLQVTGSDELVKLGVFVPFGHEEEVMEALFYCSATIGNYADCSFRVAGTGTFRPLAGSSPFIGVEGQRESVAECRIEVLLRRNDLDAAVAAVKKVHPYEEPAIDVYQLLNKAEPRGLGRYGDLSEATTLGDFAKTVKDRLEAKTIRYVGEATRRVKRVAVCGGSGASLLREAQFRGADVLVTGDIKYHEARDAEASGISIIDAGHFSTEKLMVKGLARRVEYEFGKLGVETAVIPFEGETEPFSYL